MMVFYKVVHFDYCSCSLTLVWRSNDTTTSGRHQVMRRSRKISTFPSPPSSSHLIPCPVSSQLVCRECFPLCLGEVTLYRYLRLSQTNNFSSKTLLENLFFLSCWGILLELLEALLHCNVSVSFQEMCRILTKETHFILP